MDKRLIIEHTQGPKAGLREIVGCTSELIQRYGNIPSSIPAVDFGNRVSTVALVRVEARYVLYREVVA